MLAQPKDHSSLKYAKSAGALRQGSQEVLLFELTNQSAFNRTPKDDLVYSDNEEPAPPQLPSACVGVPMFRIGRRRDDLPRLVRQWRRL